MKTVWVKNEIYWEERTFLNKISALHRPNALTDRVSVDSTGRGEFGGRLRKCHLCKNAPFTDHENPYVKISQFLFLESSLLLLYFLVKFVTFFLKH